MSLLSGYINSLDDDNFAHVWFFTFDIWAGFDVYRLSRADSHRMTINNGVAFMGNVLALITCFRASKMASSILFSGNIVPQLMILIKSETCCLCSAW